MGAYKTSSKYDDDGVKVGKALVRVMRPTLCEGKNWQRHCG